MVNRTISKCGFYSNIKIKMCWRLYDGYLDKSIWAGLFNFEFEVRDKVYHDFLDIKNKIGYNYIIRTDVCTLAQVGSKFL